MPKSSTIRIAPGFSYRPHRGGIYQLRVYDPKRQPTEKQVTLRTTSPALAARRAQEYYTEYVAGTWDPWTPDHKGVTVAVAIDAFLRARRGEVRKKTLEDYEWTIRTSMPNEYVPLESVSPDLIRKFLYSRDVSQTTRRSYWQKLSVFWTWCESEGLLENNPFNRVTAPRKPDLIPNAPTGSEYSRIIAAIHDHIERSPDDFRCIENPDWISWTLQFLAATGMRPSEARRVKWEDVTDDYIIVRSRKDRTKTDSERLVPVFDDMAPILRGCLERSRCAYVLTNHTGKGQISVSHTSRRFRFYRKRAGVKGVSLRSLRHFYAAEMVRAGVHDRDFGQFMGHRSQKTTERYGVFRQDERLERIRELANRQKEVYRQQDKPGEN